MTIRASMTTAAIAILLGSAVQAQAQPQTEAQPEAKTPSMKVWCKSGNDRSSAEVEGYHLAPGKYRSVLESGGNMAESKWERADRDNDGLTDDKDSDVDFEFDSKKSEVRDGDTKIAKDFIVGNSVNAWLLDAAGNQVAYDSATCKKR